MNEPVQEVTLEPKRAPTAGSARTAITTAIVLALAKGKALLALAPKLLLTLGSMAAMVWFEATQQGWRFGVGFVLCILIHELGHAFAIRRHQLASSWPVFIPFVGAFITLQGAVPSREAEAEIGIAGPLWGAVASTGAVALYFATAERVWLAIAMTGFLLNLFNLTPLRPLDGGRVAQLFSRYAWMLGSVILVGLFLLTWSPVLILIGLTGIPRALRKAEAQEASELESIPKAVRRRVAAEYFGLAAFLAAGYYLTHRILSAGGA